MENPEIKIRSKDEKQPKPTHDVRVHLLRVPVA